MTNPQLLQPAFARLGRHPGAAALEGEIYRLLVPVSSSRAELDSTAQASRSSSAQTLPQGNSKAGRQRGDSNPQGWSASSNHRSYLHAPNLFASHVSTPASFGMQARCMQTVTKPAAPDGDAGLADIASRSCFTSESFHSSGSSAAAFPWPQHHISRPAQHMLSVLTDGC